MNLTKEKYDVLNNIYEEICQTAVVEREENGKTQFFEGLDYCIHIIDEYRRCLNDKSGIK